MIFFYCNFNMFFQNINNYLFKNSATDAVILLNNLKDINKINNETDANYELELRFIDNNNRSSTLETYNSIDLSDAIELKYSDIMLINYKSFANNVRVRGSNETITEKTNICNIISNKENTDIKPFIIKFNIERCIKSIEKDNEPEILDYQRRQRISYRINKPYLRNWRIDKTLRLFAKYPQHKKLHCFLEKSNVEKPEIYDMLDIEFEYIGDYSEIIISFIKLFEYLYPKKYEIFNIDYNEINDKLFKITGYKLNTISPQVNIITNNFIENEDITDYVYEEKFDGERTTLISYITYTYKEHKKKVNKNINIFGLSKESIKLINTVSISVDPNGCYFNNISMVDTEKICIEDTKDGNKQYIYIIFDCLLLNNNNYNENNYLERLKKVSLFVEQFGEYVKCKKIKIKKITLNREENESKKEYNERYRNKIDKFIDIVNTRFTSSDPELENIDIDGLVFHKIHSTFIDGRIYKMKNSFMMTIDFKIMFLNENLTYYLYLIGNASDLIRLRPVINRYSIPHFGYSIINHPKSAYMLFDTPFISNAYKFEPTLNWYREESDNNKYISEHVKENINKLMQEIINNPKSFNGEIVEMALYEQSKGTYIWLPLRVRHDKINSNGYKVGLSIAEYHYNKLSSKYFKGFKQHKVNKDINNIYQYISEKYIQHINTCIINDSSNNDNNIILNTRNYDYINVLFKYAKINDLFILSNDKKILTNICNNICKGNKEIYNNIYNESKTYQNNINISCVHYNDNKDDYELDIHNKLLKTNFIPCSIDFFIDDILDYININYEKYIKTVIETLNNNGIYITITNEELNNGYAKIIKKYMTYEKVNENYANYYINIFRKI